MDKIESVSFLTEDGDSVDFYILEQTMLNGINYLLVTEDPEDEEAYVYIMKENAGEEKGELNTYIMVEDETELLSVSKIFEQLMEDIDIQIE